MAVSACSANTGDPEGSEQAERERAASSLVLDGGRAVRSALVCAKRKALRSYRVGENIRYRGRTRRDNGRTSVTVALRHCVEGRFKTVRRLQPALGPGGRYGGAFSIGINLVWTAGHCVTDGPNDFATNFMFVPGYYRGLEPNGRWTFTSLDSTPGWEAQGGDRFRYDVGAARVVKAGASSATFATTIGTRSIAFGETPAGKRLVSYGYPAAGKFNGEQQYACASPFRRWDGTALLDPMQISCDMTGGSSGGGWILDANANNVGDPGETLVSVNSYGYSFEKTTMYGPYIAAGGQAQTLYNSLK